MFYCKRIWQTPACCCQKRKEEARRIFYKEAPERAIRGTASSQEVGELKEEGIDVMAIPGTPALPEKLH